MGRSKETMARLFGFGIPRGGSKLPMKSDIWLKVMNCVACGSNLDNDSQSFFAEDKEGIYEIDERVAIIHQSHHCHIMAVMVSDSLGPLSIEHFKVFFHNSNFLLL